MSSHQHTTAAANAITDYYNSCNLSVLSMSKWNDKDWKKDF